MPDDITSKSGKSFLLTSFYFWRPLFKKKRHTWRCVQTYLSPVVYVFVTLTGVFACMLLNNNLLQIASASSEPSAHSGSPSQRHRAGTHCPFLQAKSVVAHVFFAVETKVEWLYKSKKPSQLRKGQKRSLSRNILDFIRTVLWHHPVFPKHTTAHQRVCNLFMCLKHG